MMEDSKSILKNKVYSNIHDQFKEKVPWLVDPATHVTTILNLCRQQNETNKTWVQTKFILQKFENQLPLKEFW
jgi:hypothetical protein